MRYDELTEVVKVAEHEMMAQVTPVTIRSLFDFSSCRARDQAF